MKIVAEKFLDAFKSEALKTIRVRVLGLVAMSILIPSLASGWLALKYLDETIKAQVLRDVSVHTERIGSLVSEWLNKRSMDVRAFSASYLLREEVGTLLEKGPAREVNRAHNAVKRYLSYLLEDNPLFTEFTIATVKGRVLAHQPGNGTLDMKVLKDHDLTGTEPVMVEVEGDNGGKILVIQALGSGDSKASAFFIGILDVDHILKYVGVESPPYSTAYLVDGVGKLKGRPVPAGTETTAPADVKTLFTNIGIPREYGGLTGEVVIGTGHRISHLPWFIILETSRDRAFVPLNRFRRQVIFLALLISAVLLVPALLLARTIVLPLEELSKTSRKIRGGEPGLEVSFQASGELGELVDSFNSMSLSLKNSMEELSAANSQLMVLTITDSLTGRHNRRYIVDRVDSELKLVKRTNRPLSIIMLDLDLFKNYNDKYGHIAGDEALRKLGDLFRENTRDSDVVARYGGEEFLIMMPHTDKEGAEVVAEKLRLAVEEAVFTPGGEQAKITISLGVAAAPSDGMSFDDLVEAADLAMYAAKDAGRNKVYSFNEQLTRGASPQSPQKSSPETRDPSSQSPQRPRRKKGAPSSQKTSKGRTSKQRSGPK